MMLDSLQWIFNTSCHLCLSLSFFHLKWHVFFSNGLKKLGWKIVLWNEVCFKKKIVDIKYVFIIATMEVGGLSAQ
jgi:hypothetical protein